MRQVNSVTSSLSPPAAIPEKDKKMIRLNPDVKRQLDDLIQHKGETYSDIIQRLIKHYKETMGAKKT